MAERFDVISPREGKDGKTRWIRIGAGFPKGDRVSVVLDALPLPDKEGRVSLMLTPFVPKDQQGGHGAAPQQSSGGGAPTGGFQDFADDIPF
jgi:hypothetical protein